MLRRDVDIVLVAPEDLTGAVLPFGRLREPIDWTGGALAALGMGLSVLGFE